MTWQTVALTGINVLQLVLLTWIGAWQARASHEVRKLNGTVVDEISRIRDPQVGSKSGAAAGGASDAAPPAAVSAP